MCIITSRNEIVLTRQDLQDQLADLKGELSVAKSCGNQYAINSILKDIVKTNNLLSN
jgi:hypothetical protein